MRSALSMTWPSASTRTAPTRGRSGRPRARLSVGAPPDAFNQLGQDWGRRPGGPTRSRARATRRSRPDAPGSATRAACGSTTSWACSACGGSPKGARPPTAPTCATTTRRCSACSRWRRTAPAPSSSARTSASSSRRARPPGANAGCWAPRCCGSNGTDGRRAAQGLARRCLATVTTHDLPPSAGYLALEHVAIREHLGLLTRPVEEERAHEEASIARLRDACVERGLLQSGAGIDSVVEALHRSMALTPAGCSRWAWPTSWATAGRNQPGTNDEYPNWRVPLAGPDGRPVSLEDVREADLAPVLFAALHDLKRLDLIGPLSRAALWPRAQPTARDWNNNPSGRGPRRGLRPGVPAPARAGRSGPG